MLILNHIQCSSDHLSMKIKEQFPSKICLSGRTPFLCVCALIRLQKSNWHFNKCNATKLLTPLHLSSLWCTSWVKLKRNLFGAIQLFWHKSHKEFNSDQSFWKTLARQSISRGSQAKIVNPLARVRAKKNLFYDHKNIYMSKNA